jgi:hypothetical protein
MRMWVSFLLYYGLSCLIMGDFARSGGFMRAREDLCELGKIYERSGRFMRAQGVLCSPEDDLCSPGKITAP